MRFGTEVWVLRGSEGRQPGKKGCIRLVPGRLIGARGNERFVEILAEDKLDTVGVCHIGDKLSWGKSVIFERLCDTRKVFILWPYFVEKTDERS